MRRSLLIASLIAATLTAGFLACDTPDPEAPGPLAINFDNVVGSADLKLNAELYPYQNAVGESFRVTKFNYFVSNIRLRKSDGTEYVVPQDNSYFLIEEERPASQTIKLVDIPPGSYTGMTFLIGVDSLRSLSDISRRTGVLNPGLTTHDPMYWEWNSGYIFMKLEGNSPAASAAQNNLFQYHVGGFGGGLNGKKTINNLRSVTLSFNGDAATVKARTTPVVRLTTDVLKVFNGATNVSIAKNSAVMFEPYSASVADNYKQMFTYRGIQVN